MRVWGPENPAFESQFYHLLAMGLTFSLSLRPFISMLRLIVLKRPVIPNTHDYGGYNENTFAKEPSVMPDA